MKRRRSLASADSSRSTTNAVADAVTQVKPDVVVNAIGIVKQLRTAKAAILGLNRGQRGARELEEAWIVQALVRDDGLTQVEAAHLLGQHKSWVCRRLALLEQLSAEVKADLRLGLLGPALARQLTH